MSSIPFGFNRRVFVVWNYRAFSIWVNRLTLNTFSDLQNNTIAISIVLMFIQCCLYLHNYLRQANTSGNQWLHGNLRPTKSGRLDCVILDGFVLMCFNLVCATALFRTLGSIPYIMHNSSYLKRPLIYFSLNVFWWNRIHILTTILMSDQNISPTVTYLE